MRDKYNSNRELLCEILKNRRVESGYTQQQLADYLGVDRTTYTKYETTREPGTDNLIRLASFYGTTVEGLIGEYPYSIDREYGKTELCAASPAEKNNELSKDELLLISLFRKSIRKTEIIGFVKRVATEDSDLDGKISE